MELKRDSASDSQPQAVMESICDDQDGDYLTRRAQVEQTLRQSLAKRSQMTFFHSDIHTVGAGASFKQLH